MCLLGSSKAKKKRTDDSSGSEQPEPPSTPQPPAEVPTNPKILTKVLENAKQLVRCYSYVTLIWGLATLLPLSLAPFSSCVFIQFENGGYSGVEDSIAGCTSSLS